MAQTMVKSVKPVKPQDDFDLYVNGDWYQTTTIPNHMHSWGPWQELLHENHKKIITILDRLDTQWVHPNTSEGKLQSLWRSGKYFSKDSDNYDRSFDCMLRLYNLITP